LWLDGRQPTSTPASSETETNLSDQTSTRTPKITQPEMARLVAHSPLRSRCGHFPSEQAALKVLYLAVRNLDSFRSPSVGTRSSGWKQALQAFTIYFEGRIPTP
jgi:transposase-like protein